MGEMQNQNTANLVNEEKSSRQIQLVGFRIENEDFGIDISKVQEINRMVEITKIPQSAEFVEGVINLRGKIIPVIDLKRRFGFTKSTTRTKENRIVVIEASGNTVGFIVDEVNEVLRIKEDSIEPTPELVNSNVDIRYIQGVAQVEENLLIVLNTDLIFSKEEQISLSEVVSS